MNDYVYQFLLEKLDSANPYREGIKACCPFHGEDTPSFFVFHADSSRATGWFFKCHGCRKSGSLYYLLQRLNGPVDQIVKPVYDGSFSRRDDDEDTVPYLPDITKGMTVDFSYYMARGISAEVCAKFGFKAVPLEPSIVMPVYTRYRYRGYVKRSLDPFITYRYMLQIGGVFDDALWGWDAINKDEPVIVTEGIIDAACWWTAGYQAVALITGKKWEGKLHLLSQLKQPYYVPDNGDGDSFDSFLRLHIKNPGRMIFIPPEYKDTSDVIASQGVTVLSQLYQKANGQA